MGLTPDVFAGTVTDGDVSRQPFVGGVFVLYLIALGLANSFANPCSVGALVSSTTAARISLVWRSGMATTACLPTVPRPADGRYGPWMAVDIDVSVFDNSDTKKQGVSWTYKKVDGFSPIFAYLGREGYLINCQLREGRQHSQEGAGDFIRDTLRLARRITKEKLLVRMDSAHDDMGTVRQLRRATKTDFIVKRNLRRESKQTWLEEAQALGQRSCPRPGKEIFIGSLVEERKDVFERVVFEVVRRTISADGQALLIPEVEVQTWWTNLAAPPADVIRLYREHSTCEQFHSELKTDMDLERLPSGKFATNALLLFAGHDGLQRSAPVRPDEPARGEPSACRKAGDLCVKRPGAAVSEASFWISCTKPLAGSGTGAVSASASGISTPGSMSGGEPTCEPAYEGNDLTGAFFSAEPKAPVCPLLRPPGSGRARGSDIRSNACRQYENPMLTRA